MPDAPGDPYKALFGFARMTINSILSPDLLLEILDYLAVPLHLHERSCDLPILVACSMVCKAWSPHAQRLLFRRVILPHNMYQEPHLRGTTRNSLPSFLEAIDPATEHGRWLADSVVSFNLRQTGRERTTYYPAALATALLRMPNLRHLEVTTLSCDFDAETLARITLECGPRITSLCIHLDFSPSQPQPRIMHRFIASLPALRLLEITADSAGSLPVFDPPLRLPLAAAKFHIAFGDDIGSCLTSLVRGDSEAALAEPALQLLAHKSTGGHPVALREVLREQGAYLRSLSLKPLESAQSIALCTRLERLELGRFPDNATLALIPRSITALAVAGLPHNLNFNALVQQLAAAAFPRLRALTWTSCPDPIVLPFSALKAVCAERGITLRLIKSPADLTDENAVELELRRKHIRI
ncbi:hypothetical protein FB451DRAFT_1555619 [Mycena latifolia]|nr:hypothetical protein FB451DRAFT_1555619 [Mycena latifolia]